MKPTTDAPAALNALSDELNTALCDAEEALEGLKLGATGCTPIDLGPDSAYSALEWSKSGSHWGLHLVGKDPKTEKLWVNKASRAARIAVAHVLPDLLVVLRANVEGQVPKVREAVDRVRAFIASLQPPSATRMRRCRFCGNAEEACGKPCRVAGDGLHSIQEAAE